MAASSPLALPCAYLDTSAYLAILLAEGSAEKVRTILKQYALCSSTLLFLEAERNIVRLARERSISSTDLIAVREQIMSDVELFATKEPTIEVCLSNQFPNVTTPRSLDLLHLRTALWFKQNTGLALFVSLDQPQLRSAQEMGLLVWEQ